MKEKVSGKTKESSHRTLRKSTALTSDEKVKVLRRKYENLKGESLEEQFKNIVETSRSSTVTKIIMDKIKGSPSSGAVKLEPTSCCTPVRPSYAKDFDGAPSPMTPPVPKRMRFSKDMEDAPSPEGGSTSPSSSPLLQTETLFISDDSEEKEEDTTFFDAHDTSVNESGKGLNLDGLIDEIFVNLPDGVEGKEKDPLTCTTPEKCLEATEAGIVNQPDPLNSSNTSPTSHADLAISALQNKATEVISEIYRADTEMAVSSPATIDMDPAISSPQNKAPEVYHEEDPVDTEPAVSHEESGTKDTTPKKNHEDVPSLAENSTAFVAPLNNEESNRGPLLPAVLPILGNGGKEDVLSEVLPILNRSDGKSQSSQGSLLDAFLNEEGFREDFSLSDSQILDIDAQCDLLRATTFQPSTDLCFKGSRSEGSHVNKSKSLPVEPTPVENPSMVLSKPALDLGFSVPQAPRLDWMQRAVESRQRLRAITQEISRLNAMVLRARRTLWPRPQQDVERQPASTSATGSSRFQPVTSQDRLQPPHVSDICDDPEWNLS